MLVIFFFSSRRRHTRCSRDWSSDVCSSDLMAPLKVQIAVWLVGALAEETWRVTAIAALVTSRNSPLFSVVAVSVALDRKSVVEGKSVDLGGRRIIKKKKNKIIRMILSFIRG